MCNITEVPKPLPNKCKEILSNSCRNCYYWSDITISLQKKPSR